MENKGDSSSPNKKSLPSSFENPNPSEIQENSNEGDPSESDQTMSVDGSATQVVVEGGSEGSEEEVITKEEGESSGKKIDEANNDNSRVGSKRKLAFNYNKFNGYYVDVRGVPSLPKAPAGSSRSIPRSPQLQLQESGKRSARGKEDSPVREGPKTRGGEARKKRKIVNKGESSSSSTITTIQDVEQPPDVDGKIDEVMKNSKNDVETTKEAPPTIEEEKMDVEDDEEGEADDDDIQMVEKVDDDDVIDAVIDEIVKKVVAVATNDGDEEENNNKEQQLLAANEEDGDADAELNELPPVTSVARNNVKHDFDLNELPPEAAEGNYF